jgi:undecaprenyl diphosphate synthase
MIKHLAIQMDGNRRWAKQQGLRAFYGHGQGLKTVQKVIDYCLENSIPYLSLYTLSLENLKRSPEELHYLFSLLVNEGKNRMIEAVEKGARIKFIGDRSKFPQETREAVEEIERKTITGNKLQVNLMFCYGSQQEIVAGVKTLIEKVQAGQLSMDQLNEQLFQDHLWTAGIPSPELVIKTGGRQRLSNFLLYQAAYSELYFPDCLWPDLQVSHLQEAMNYYQSCQRNFGS